MAYDIVPLRVFADKINALTADNAALRARIADLEEQISEWRDCHRGQINRAKLAEARVAALEALCKAAGLSMERTLEELADAVVAKNAAEARVATLEAALLEFGEQAGATTEGEATTRADEPDSRTICRCGRPAFYAQGDRTPYCPGCEYGPCSICDCVALAAGQARAAS